MKYYDLKKVDQELALTDAELELLIRAMYAECVKYVFEFLRACDLDGYKPAAREMEAAYGKLCVLFVCAEFANQVLTHYIREENVKRIRDGAEDDGRFIEASESLRGYDYAPFIAEIPYKAAFALWAIAGSWAGAMELCGLEMANGKVRKELLARYAIARARPALAPEGIRSAMDGECYKILNELCERARTTGRYIHENKINVNYKIKFKQRGLKLESVLNDVGIPPAYDMTRRITEGKRYENTAHYMNPGAYERNKKRNG